MGGYGKFFMVNWRAQWIPAGKVRKDLSGGHESRSTYLHMEVENRAGQYFKSLRISAEIAYRTVRSWWASVIDKRDPKLRIPLLVVGDVIGWAALLLGGCCLAGLGIVALVIVLRLLLFPFYFMTLKLGWNHLSHRNTLVYGLGGLTISNVLLLCLLWWLRMPESEVLRRKYGIDREESPEKIIERFQIISLVVLWLGGSAYAAVFCLDLLVLSVSSLYAIYFALSGCYSFLRFLLKTIPLYVTLPITIITPLIVISLYRRMSREVWIRSGTWQKLTCEHGSVVSSPVHPGRLPV